MFLMGVGHDRLEDAVTGREGADHFLRAGLGRLGRERGHRGEVADLLGGLLEKDLENQGGAAPMAEKLAAFRKDPKAWLNANLNPRTYESICTIDWSKWVPTA